MVRIGKWVLTLGIVAVAPGLAAAASYPWQADTDTAAAAQKSKNQQVAENIALALKKSAFHGYEIDIEYRNGLATLRGKVSDPRQKARASQIVSTVGGVQRVDNRLTVVAASESSVRQVTATNADLAAPAQQQASAQQASAPGQPAPTVAANGTVTAPLVAAPRRHKSINSPVSVTSTEAARQQARFLLWAISGCAGPPAAWQVNP